MTALTVPASSPTAELVKNLLDAAHQAASSMNAAVCIAVVDSGGNLAGFLRIPGAFFVSIDLAIDKAWTAVGIKMSTRTMSEVLRTMPDAARDGILRRPRLTEVPGGFPLMIGDQIIGAVGVSGGSVEEDEAIAVAAMSALESAK